MNVRCYRLVLLTTLGVFSAAALFISMPALSEVRQSPAARSRTGTRDSSLTRYAREKRALVLELLRISNAEDQVRQVITTMIESLPYELRDAFREILSAEEMLAKMVPIYERYLSVEDLKAIIAFCKTPAGAHWVAAQPKITHDAMIVMKVYTQEKLEQYLKNSKVK